MKPKHKFTAYLVTSAHGYIARPDGDVEWLNVVGLRYEVTP
jgi:hypothetical protein